MKVVSELKNLLKPLSSLEKLMKRAGCPWMIIGGVASGLLGKPRFTADIDIVILIEDKDVSDILRLAEELGFKRRIKDALGFANINRVLLLKHEESSIDVDISLGLLPFERKAIKKSRQYKIGNVTFNLPLPEDLIILKAIAHRPLDIIDIQEIVNSNPKINIGYIKKTVSEFARILDMPEIWNDIKNIITKKHGSRNSKT